MLKTFKVKLNKRELTMMYTGNSSYCYSNSLHMCLRQAKMHDLPDVSFLECLTGMPFGASFFKFETPMFFPSPVSTEPDTGLTQALETLGWTCELWQGDDAGEAKAELDKALRYGPVLLGPIDMGFLSYDPNHEGKRGADHFIVVLKVEDDITQLHDPQFYPYVTLPIDELIQAWCADHIGYIDKNYTMRYRFQEQHKMLKKQMFETTLEIAKKLQTDSSKGPIAYGGAAAFEQALNLLEKVPSPAFASLLTHFALPIGAKRSIDAMHFTKEAGNAELASLFDTKANLFGSAQYYAVTEDWAKVTERFVELTEIEKQLAEQMKS